MFIGEYTHEEYLQNCFDLIEFVINKTGIDLTPMNMKDLWGQFVFEPICEEETNFYYLKLIKPLNEDSK